MHLECIGGIAKYQLVHWYWHNGPSCSQQQYDSFHKLILGEWKEVRFPHVLFRNYNSQHHPGWSSYNLIDLLPSDTHLEVNDIHVGANVSDVMPSFKSYWMKWLLMWVFHTVKPNIIQSIFCLSPKCQINTMMHACYCEYILHEQLMYIK
jgi:hypothetical protein